MSRGQPNIVVVTPHFPIPEEPYRGRSIYETMRQLSRMANVKVLCSVAKYPPLSWLYPKSYRYYRPPVSPLMTEVDTKFFEYPVFPLISRPLNGRLCREHLLPLLRQSKPDLVLACWIYPEGYAAVSAAQALGIPSVVMGRGSDLRRIKGVLRRRLTTQVLKQASCVITVSEELRRRAIRLGSSATRTWPVLNGCDFSVFHPRNRADERVELDFPVDAELVLFVGHLLPSKGLRDLLASVETMSQERRHLRLAIIGEGRMRSEIQAWVQRSAFSSRVILLGQCNSPQVARWMNAADVFCLPSHSEGCPSAIIEALACGRPVVATEVGGIPELINDRNGLLVPARDVKSLTRALELALDRSWSATVISNQFQRTWTDVAQETLAICESALYATATDRAPRPEIQSVPAAA